MKIEIDEQKQKRLTVVRPYACGGGKADEGKEVVSETSGSAKAQGK